MSSENGESTAPVHAVVRETGEYLCVEINCNRVASYALLTKASALPLCEDHARYQLWLESKIVPLADALDRD